MAHPTRRFCPSRTLRHFSFFGVLLASVHIACSEDADSQDGTAGNTTDLGSTASTGTGGMGGSGSVSMTNSVTSGMTTTSSASATTTGTQTSTTTTTTASGTTGTATETTGTQTTATMTASSSATGTTAGAGGSSMGAGGATVTGGGGSSSGNFQPCPETGPCKILPLGDSITFGLGFDGGYRVHLFHLALEDDHEITFTGTQSPNGPDMVDGVTFPKDHEGISGETIQQIANRVPTPALTDMPHIVLLHAGTNDMVQGANGASDRLGALMDELTSEAPDALIVVSNIIPAPSFNSTIMTYNAPIQGMVEERANAGKHIVFCDQFSDFPDDGLGDPVHPNEAGYAAMAEAWYGVIEPYLR